MSKTTGFKKLLRRFLLVLFGFLFQACVTDTGVCSHPWIVVGFDAESIGTTTGYVDTWEIFDWGGKNAIMFPIGLEPLDQLALENDFKFMIQMYTTNEYPEWLFTEYGVYPLNVFLMDPGVGVAGNYNQRIYSVINALKKDENILYLNQISCTTKYCREHF